MDYIHVEGVPPYDGKYEFDLRDAAFTVREWGWIKRHSGYLPFTLWDGLQGSDAELLAVMALIAMVRAGKVDRRDVPDVWERFADAPGVVTVRLELTSEEEDDTDPLSNESRNGNGSTSGDDSTQSSGRSDETQPPSGIHGSATSASHPATPLGS